MLFFLFFFFFILVGGGVEEKNSKVLPSNSLSLDHDRLPSPRTMK